MSGFKHKHSQGHENKATARRGPASPAALRQRCLRLCVQLRDFLWVFVFLSLACALSGLQATWASQLGGQEAALEAAGPSAEPAAPVEPAAAGAGGTIASAPKPPPDKSINVMNLALQGGVFMIPITALSLLAVTMIIERLLGLRRQKVLPGGLVADFGQLGGSAGGFDPRKAYRICQQHPSAASNVIKAMLVKVGRPLPEVEHTVAETSEREADRLYRNVRWLNLCASLAPLLGLLGTVQGMIIAFHQTTVLDPGQNKSLALAEGIYTALVTTFAGLVVAIPAALFSHYFEGRIQALFHEIDELVFSLLPQIERYEGRVRFGRHADESEPPRQEAEKRPAQQVPAAQAET